MDQILTNNKKKPPKDITLARKPNQITIREDGSVVIGKDKVSESSMVGSALGTFTGKEPEYKMPYMQRDRSR